MFSTKHSTCKDAQLAAICLKNIAEVICKLGTCLWHNTQPAHCVTVTYTLQVVSRLKELAETASEMQVAAQRASEAAAKDRKAAEAARKVCVCLCLCV